MKRSSEALEGQTSGGVSDEDPEEVEARTLAWGVWSLALVATVAAVLSRAVAPSLLGVWEGADHIIAAATLGAAVLSQLVAVGSSAVIIGLVLGTVKSAQPQYIRAFSVGVAMLVLLALSISSVNQQLPEKSRMVVAGAAALLVLVSMRVSARIFTLRAASLALGGVAVAGLVRMVSTALASHAIDTAAPMWATAAKVSATVYWLVDVSALGLCLAVLTTQARGDRRLRRPRWTTLGIVLVVPLFFMLAVSLGQEPERTGFVALVTNIARNNRVLPGPLIPLPIQQYLEVLRWVAAAAMLWIMPRSRLLAGALALALFSRSTLEVPLCAAAAVVGALAIGLHQPPNLSEEALHLSERA